MIVPSSSPAAHDELDVARFLVRTLPGLIRLRRFIHQNPEPSNAEFATTAIVATHLEAAGLAPKLLQSNTGLICDIGSSMGGPTIAFRAELDGLRMQERSEVSYRSNVPGVAHSCGHDLHIAILVGTGVLLAEAASARSLPPGSVRLIFQPAEEVIPGGAQRVISEGSLDGVDYIFAVHADPTLPTGQVALKQGPITSGADLVDLTLTGPGGHTARPSETVDLIRLAARVVEELPKSLGSAYNMVFGIIRSGNSINVVPTRARLKGVLRTGTPALWDDGPRRMRAILDDLVGSAGGKYSVSITRGFPPILNDGAATAIVDMAARKSLGPRAVRRAAQSMGGDDFGWYLEHVPGCYARLGVQARNAAAPAAGLHSPFFEADEMALPVGVRLLSQLAIEALRGEARES